MHATGYRSPDSTFPSYPHIHAFSTWIHTSRVSWQSRNPYSGHTWDGDSNSLGTWGNSTSPDVSAKSLFPLFIRTRRASICMLAGTLLSIAETTHPQTPFIKMSRWVDCVPLHPCGTVDDDGDAHLVWIGSGTARDSGITIMKVSAVGPRWHGLSNRIYAEPPHLGNLET